MLNFVGIHFHFSRCHTYGHLVKDCLLKLHGREWRRNNGEGVDLVVEKASPSKIFDGNPKGLVVMT